MSFAGDTLLMPKLGLTMSEGVLSEWRVRAGQEVEVGDTIFIVETDKIATEIEAARSGTIAELLVEEGQVVEVGAVVGRWTSEGAPSAAARTGSPLVDSGYVENNGGAATNTPPASADRVLVTPLARRLAREGNIELNTLMGSGPKGRVKAADVRRALEAALRPGQEKGPQQAREPAKALEKTIARRLTSSKAEIPHFYVSAEAEVSELLALRESLARQVDGLRVSINDFIVLACGRSLLDMPDANRVWEDDGYVRLSAPDVGVAVQTERGLFAPVAKGIGHLSLDMASRQLATLLDRARNGALRPSDLEGGALSVSNVGMFGVSSLTPIVNPGQSSILGVGAVREVFRPHPDTAQAHLRRELTLTLAADHRVLDGVRGAGLLKRIINYLEKPLLLMTIPQRSAENA